MKILHATGEMACVYGSLVAIKIRADNASTFGEGRAGTGFTCTTESGAGGDRIYVHEVCNVQYEMGFELQTMSEICPWVHDHDCLSPSPAAALSCLSSMYPPSNHVELVEARSCFESARAGAIPCR